MTFLDVFLLAGQALAVHVELLEKALTGFMYITNKLCNIYSGYLLVYSCH